MTYAGKIWAEVDAEASSEEQADRYDAGADRALAGDLAAVRQLRRTIAHLIAEADSGPPSAGGRALDRGLRRP